MSVLTLSMHFSTAGFIFIHLTIVVLRSKSSARREDRRWCLVKQVLELKIIVFSGGVHTFTLKYVSISMAAIVPYGNI